MTAISFLDVQVPVHDPLPFHSHCHPTIHAMNPSYQLHLQLPRQDWHRSQHRCRPNWTDNTVPLGTILASNSLSRRAGVRGSTWKKIKHGLTKPQCHVTALRIEYRQAFRQAFSTNLLVIGRILGPHPISVVCSEIFRK